MIKILDKPKLACITTEKLYVVIGTYYGYPLALNLREVLTIKSPEELSKDMLSIFTEGKYCIPLTNYIRFSTIKEKYRFCQESFWIKEEWEKFKTMWRTMKQNINSSMIKDLCESIFKYSFYRIYHNDKNHGLPQYKERKEIYFYFVKGFKLQSVYGSKTYRYHLGNPYFEILKHPKNPDQTIERMPFFIDRSTNLEESSVDWFNTEQFKTMNEFMKIAKEIFDIDLSEEEDIVYE